MHVNKLRPNILQDTQAAANGMDLRNRDRNGNVSAKRQLTLRRSYPYQSKRQIERHREKSR